METIEQKHNYTLEECDKDNKKKCLMASYRFSNHPVELKFYLNENEIKQLFQGRDMNNRDNIVKTLESAIAFEKMQAQLKPREAVKQKTIKI